MERDDHDMLEVTRDWRHALRDWLRNPDPHIPVWQAFVAFVLLVLVAVFSINAFAPGGIGDIIGGPGEEGTEGGSDSTPAAEDADSPPAEEPAAEAEEAAVDEEVPAVSAAPAHFVGTIVSDNGWFTITVTADGQASGTLNVQQTAQGDSSVSSGTFAGTIAADDVVTCNGTFTGTTFAANGQQWPHQGTVSVRAAPTSSDRSVWQIDMAAEPGSATSLPAHAQ